MNHEPSRDPPLPDPGAPRRCWLGRGPRIEPAVADSPISRTRVVNLLEAEARLSIFARPILENLYRQIGNPHSAVLLANHDGQILNAVGNHASLDRAAQVARSPDVVWDERVFSANDGDHTPVARVLPSSTQGLHFVARNRFLTCVAAPVFGMSGGIVGILDLSAGTRLDVAHAHALLVTTADLIEHRLVTNLDEGFVALHFHSNPALLGTPLEGLACFNEDEQLVGSNRAARSLLGLDDAQLDTRYPACFATRWKHLLDWAAIGQATLFPIRTVSGRTLYARASLRALAGSPLQELTAASGLRQLQLGDARVAEAATKLALAAAHSVPLAITGETGTGKSRFCAALHEDFRATPEAPFVTIDCTTLSPGEPGLTEAFAALHACEGGTLVLRQVTALEPAYQARLFEAVAGNRAIRLVATTHRRLSDLIASGRFAHEAFDRSKGCAVELPALRERSDFDALVRHCVRELVGGREVHVRPEAISRLHRYAWPGNLSELHGHLRLILALMSDETRELCAEDIPDELLDDG